MTIEHKFLYYPKRAQFELEKDNIADTSIAFIEDSGTIYTHKHEFGGSNSGVDPSDLISLEQRLNDELGIRLSREINALAGTITDMATRNYVDSQLTNFGQSLNITNRVLQVLDAQTPSWKAVVERIGRLEGSNLEILNQIAEIVASTTDLGSQVDLSAVYTRLYNLENAQTADETWKVQTTARINALATGDSATLTLEAIYSAIDNDVERRIVSKIFLQANENGSSITLHADKINLEGDTSELEAFINGVVNITSPDGSSFGYLYAKGIVFEDNSSTPHTRTELTSDNGLRHVITSGSDANGTNGGYWLKPDGSGLLAFGNISWNRDGKLTVQGIIKPDAANSVFEIDRIYRIPTDYNTTNRTYTYLNNVHYNIIKDGFLVKSGMIDQVSMFWLESDQIGQSSATDGSYYHRFSWEQEGVTVNAINIFAYYMPAFTNVTKIMGMLNGLTPQEFLDVFKINGSYIFETGESVTIRCTDLVQTAIGGLATKFYLDDENTVYHVPANSRVIARQPIPDGLTSPIVNADSTTAAYTRLLNQYDIDHLKDEVEECMGSVGYFDILPVVRYISDSTWHKGYFYNDGSVIEEEGELNGRPQPMRYIDVIYVRRGTEYTGEDAYGDGAVTSDSYWKCIDSELASNHAPGVFNSTGVDPTTTGWEELSNNQGPNVLSKSLSAKSLQFLSKTIIFEGDSNVSWNNK